MLSGVLLLFIASDILNKLIKVETRPSSHSDLRAFSQIQLLLILPLFQVYMPDKVIRIILNARFALLSFLFFKLDYIPFKENFKEEYDYPQLNPYLKLADFESGSSLLNIFNSVGIFLAIVMVHLLLLLIIVISSRRSVSRIEK